MRKYLIFFCLLTIFPRCGELEKPWPDPPPATRASQPVVKKQPKQVVSQTPRRPHGTLKKAPNRRTTGSSGVIGTPAGGSGEVQPFRDTILLRDLPAMRAGRIIPDLNEPATRNLLSAEPVPGVYRSLITVSPEILLRINFDNDILDYTDRFYTNGLRIELISPALRFNPVSRLLLPYRGAATNYYGLALVQNMYTPSTTKVGGIMRGDRPYAAYLYAGSFKISNDPGKKFRQTSGIDLGIIGPDSYGEWVQRSFHNSVPTNHEPLGWEYQIRNDVVADYHVLLEKGLLTGRSAEWLVAGGGRLGTLYTHLTAGVQFRTGWMNGYFTGLGVPNRRMPMAAGQRKFQVWFFAKGAAKLIGYDATLQGGLFNRSSVYRFNADEISRGVFQGSGGVVVTVKGFRLEAEQFLLSPEFRKGWWHKWVHLALTFSL